MFIQMSSGWSTFQTYFFLSLFLVYVFCFRYCCCSLLLCSYFVVNDIWKYIYNCLQFIIPFFSFSVSIFDVVQYYHFNQFLCNPCSWRVKMFLNKKKTHALRWESEKRIGMEKNIWETKRNSKNSTSNDCKSF